MFRYIGSGEFIPGVPARDLTDEEAEAHGVTKCKLYERMEKPDRAEEVEDDGNGD